MDNPKPQTLPAAQAHEARPAREPGPARNSRAARRPARLALTKTFVSSAPRPDRRSRSGGALPAARVHRLLSGGPNVRPRPDVLASHYHHAG